MNLSRRGFIASLGVALAAPAIVKAELLMPVKQPLIGRILDEHGWFPKPKVLLHASLTAPKEVSVGDMWYNTFEKKLYISSPELIDGVQKLVFKPALHR